ncbi:MAG: TIGR04282 family arsenosugar biosynthesis glycosyltransferase [Cyanobacteria bacterium P01_D01_bin.1]
MSPSCRLLLFLRYPQPGRTKTRLIPALGAAGAAQLQRQMAEYLLAKISHPDWETQIHFSGTSLQEMQAWLGPHRSYRSQVKGDLGERLWSGFRSAFAEGDAQSPNQSPTQVIAIGADCPDLSVRHIHRAFEQLDHHDLVIGPAKDGGYYLIGLRQSAKQTAEQSTPTAQQALFKNISWSTAAVLQQTIDKAQTLGLSMSQLEMLSDVDRPQDLPIWYRLQSVA